VPDARLRGGGGDLREFRGISIAAGRAEQQWHTT
jgi:hypothetical protein